MACKECAIFLFLFLFYWRDSFLFVYQVGWGEIPRKRHDWGGGIGVGWVNTGVFSFFLTR